MKYQNIIPAVLCVATFCLVAAIPQPTADAVLTGFTPEHSKKQRQLEKKFDSYLSAKDLRRRMKQMSSKPNQLGSPHDKKNAEFLKNKFTEWGWDAHIETFSVLFPTPKERVLEMIAPTQFKASLKEPAFDQDATSNIRKNSLPPYNAYSADGNVSAELVYVNQGVPDDYKELEKHGISVKGKIVIAQYGGSWRGIKPKVAYEHGAVGCILYSDPKGNGYRAGDVYPQGSWRPDVGVQLGSVMDMPIHPGDPLTPGIGATEDAKRLDRDEAKTILKIPVLPISYKDAKPLLAALKGPKAPRSWQGALPITYHIGARPAKVHMKTAFNWDQVTLYDVIAKLEGSKYPDQWVIRGNHMDGWLFGAKDPLSGNVAMTEEAKAIGKLAKNGWRPKRTIIYASWDGEEPGLLGSTEWAEQHADELRKKATIYVNSDNNNRGFLSARGSHSLQHFINQVAADVPDPQTDVSVQQRLRVRRMVNGNKDAVGSGDLSIYPLGSGSDYTPFLQHLGIASLDLSFRGEGGGGVYHSRYDSFDHYIRFADPTFEYGVALSKTAGRAVLRFANADLLPYQFSDMSEEIINYQEQLKKETTSMRKETEYQKILHKNNAYQLAADPTKTYHAPERMAKVPYINFSPLENATARLSEVVNIFKSAYSAQMNNSITLSNDEVTTVNQLMQSAEQMLTDPEGLPRRPWYKHQIYAPGLYTGYGVKTLPGVREAIELRKWEEADHEIAIAEKTINNYTDRIEKMTKILKH